MPIAPYKGAKRKTVEYAKIIILEKVFLNLSHMSGGVTSLGEGRGSILESSISYVRKIFRKTNISCPLMRTRTFSFNDDLVWVVYVEPRKPM